MSTTIENAGKALVERLGLHVLGAEGHDLMVPCVSCTSSDAGRIHQKSGVFHCYACGKALNAFDLCKVIRGDHQAAIDTMVSVGLFEPAPVHKGNGHSSASPIQADEDAYFEVCRLKRMPPKAVKEYGGEPWRGGVRIPMWGPDLKTCSSIHITPENGKGLYAKGKPTGLFLPGRSPDPGESWLIVEGVKDAAALRDLGHLAAGLPGNRMKPDFAPLFQDCEVVVISDGDKAGREGATITAGLLWPHAKSVKTTTCPDGKDIRDVLATYGVEGVGRILLDACEAGQDGRAGNSEPMPFTRLLTSAEFLALDLKPKFLVRGILAAGQPGVIGGRSKCLKTSIACDLVVSVASGADFLGHFRTTQANVAFWSGESGAATIRETALRVAASRGVDLADCPIIWGFDLPKLSRADHIEAMADIIKTNSLELVVVDPLYLALLSAESAGRSSDLFFMGSVLQPLAEVCQATGAALVVLHHFRKNSPADDTEPAGLEELAQSGVAEFCRQWLLLARRTPYAHDGRHDLWMRAGGSVGHGGLWGVDINEGLLDLDTLDGRIWEVGVRSISDTRDEVKREREDRKAKDLERRDGEHRDRLLVALRQCPAGETAKRLRTLARLNPDGFERAIHTLTKEGRVEECIITKTRGTYEGYRLVEQ